MESFTITRIAGVGRNRGQVRVLLDNETSFKLATAIFLKAGLKAGGKLTDSQLKQLQRQQQEQLLKESAFRLLGVRAHSVRELQQKLLRKGFAEDMIALVLTELQTNGVLDDREFARGYARNRLITKPMGARLLRRELWQKGVSDEIINLTLRDVYAERDPRAMARELALKRNSRYSHLKDSQRRKRLGDLLTRRGFEWEIIKQLVEELSDRRTRFQRS